MNIKNYRPVWYVPPVKQMGGRRFCTRCPNPLQPWAKYYCSGFCMNGAKMDGSYGKEEER